ncbi:hypothetical protein DL769_011276 [Monosporascus sp. CRB-8-3]|nr:hypothetical protein DL769_011276 [Monosporascus sp. CRB-8-3]
MTNIYLDENGVIVISSDDESDYDDIDDGQSDTSDTSLPSLGELLRQPAKGKDAEPGSVASAEQGFNAKSSAVGESDAREPPVTDGADINDESASSQRQRADSLGRFPTPPSSPALPRRSSASGVLRAEQDHPAPAANASYGAGQAAIAGDATCRNTADELDLGLPVAASESDDSGGQHSYLVTATRHPQQRHPHFRGARDASCEAGQASDPEDATPSFQIFSAPRNGKHQDSILSHDSAGQGDGDDRVKSPWTMPKWGQKRAAVRRGIRRPRDDASDIGSDDEVEAARQTDSQGKPQHYLGHCQYNRAEGAADESVYHPSEGIGRD